MRNLLINFTISGMALASQALQANDDTTVLNAHIFQNSTKPEVLQVTGWTESEFDTVVNAVLTSPDIAQETRNVLDAMIANETAIEVNSVGQLILDLVKQSNVTLTIDNITVNGNQVLLEVFNDSASEVDIVLQRFPNGNLEQAPVDVGVSVTLPAQTALTFTYPVDGEKNFFRTKTTGGGSSLNEAVVEILCP